MSKYNTRDKIINGEIKLYYRLGEKEFELKTPYCKLCGKLLDWRSENSKHYVRPCHHCLPKNKCASVLKIKSVLGDEVNCEELYHYISKYRTRKFVYSPEIQARKSKLGWEKVLSKHPEKISTHIEYYLAKGMNEEEAKQALKDRQSTFTLEKCIKKYGEEKGRKVWLERQEKWQASLNNKSVDEITCIRKKQICNGLSYSNISQELFWNIYEEIKNEYQDIFFATLFNDKEKYQISKSTNKKKNYEYYYRNDELKRGYFLDFYIKDNNKVIEFDGDYWHHRDKLSEAKDKMRNTILKKAGFKILHIKELDFKNNPDIIIKKCLDWIRK